MSKDESEVLVSSEFWMHRVFDLAHFVSAFNAQFPDGRVEDVFEEMDEEDYRLVVLIMPAALQQQLQPFLEAYALSRGATFFTTRPGRGSYLD